ncbi:MAG: hypothetical protein GVY11_05275 [Gammaproteobacteria bacterium]|jgi:outer membrane PBP1 activator LpoA protein|nr:hypothetical protein [Gammaproteobacteria bacterium]
MPKPLTVLLAAMICCACSDNAATPDKDDADESSRAKTGYEQSLDRAREVEDDVLEAAEEQKKAIDEQTGGG